MDFLEAIHAEDQTGIHKRTSEQCQLFSGELDNTFCFCSCVGDLVYNVHSEFFNLRCRLKSKHFSHHSLLDTYVHSSGLVQ